MVNKLFKLTLLFGLIALQGIAQSRTIKLNLLKLDSEKGLTVTGRHSSVTGVGNEAVFKFDEQPDAGIAWLNDLAFVNGTIEFDVKGRDIFQQSFLGFAFHGVNDQTYGAIYFRPFNFKADDAERKGHAVQYISLPDYDWPKLREAFPNRYEQPLNPAPDPNNWFHAKIVITGPTYSVYVNGSAKPALVVQQLANLPGTKIGFWVGNGSGGEWKNVVITTTK